MVLAYHQIVQQPCEYRYSLDTSLFSEHIALLGSIKHPVLVTFDDGHGSQFCHALPILEKHSVPGVFFVTAGWVGREHYMSWGNLREMHRRGYRIESHGWAHKMLTDCTREELQEELQRSKAFLEDGLGDAVDAISCPGGACSPAVVEACAKAGYRTVYTSEPWAAPRIENGITVVGRLMVRRKCAPETLRSLIDAEHHALAPVRIQFAVAKAARKTLGLQLYHSLWCWFAKWSPDSEGAQ